MSLANNCWARHKVDGANSGYFPYPSVGTEAHIEWTHVNPVYDLSEHNMIVDTNGILYKTSHITSNTTGLKAINPVDGTLMWQLQSLSSPKYPAISSDGTIYLASGQGLSSGAKLQAINPNGTEEWAINLRDLYYYIYDTSALSILDNGNIAFGDDARIFIIDPITKTLVSRPLDHCEAPLAIDSTGIYYIDSSYDKIKCRGNDYTIAWETIMPDISYSWNCVVLSSDTVYSLWGTYLYALDKSTGDIKWLYDLGINTASTVRTPLCYTPDGNIVSVILGGIGVFDVSGNLIRSITLTGTHEVREIFVDSNGIAYVTSRKYYDPPDQSIFSVTAIDKNTGTIYWELDFTTGTYGDVKCASGLNCIYVTSSNGTYKITKPPIILPQVQCRATQIIASANTGKLILAVPIL